MLYARACLLRPCTDGYQYSVSQTLWTIYCLIHSCSNNVTQCENTQLVWTGNASLYELSLLSAGKSSHRPRTIQMLICIQRYPPSWHIAGANRLQYYGQSVHMAGYRGFRLLDSSNKRCNGSYCSNRYAYNLWSQYDV
jgi:hypothetical protein